MRLLKSANDDSTMGMLEWKSNERADHKAFEAVVSGKPGQSTLDAAMADVWARVLDELDKQPADDWEILIVEFITQCGAFFVYAGPAHAEETATPRFSVNVTVEQWTIDYDQLPDVEDGSTFDRAYERLHKAQLGAVKRGILDDRINRRFAKLKRRKSFAVFAADEGEAFVWDRMEFVWGNRPRKRQFKSAKELLEHTLRKAELEPEYSLRLRGDLVTGVNWGGNEFTDKYVDLLEGIPNVRQLCEGLRDFMLTATRITPVGVKRLKKLLPDVRFTVVSRHDCVVKGIDPWYKPRFLGGQES